MLLLLYARRFWVSLFLPISNAVH